MDNEDDDMLKPQPTVYFLQASDDYGSERAARGVPSDLDIPLKIEIGDVEDKPFTNPKKILERLEKYQKTLDDAMQWNDKELTMLKMTLRDSFT